MILRNSLGTEPSYSEERVLTDRLSGVRLRVPLRHAQHLYRYAQSRIAGLAFQRLNRRQLSAYNQCRHSHTTSGPERVDVRVTCATYLPMRSQRRKTTRSREGVQDRMNGGVYDENTYTYVRRHGTLLLNVTE